MKNIVAILAFVLFALTIFGADATSNSSLKKCRNDLKKEQSKLKSCKNQVDGKAKKISELAFDPTPEAIVKNLPQDYCSKFKKGGSRAGVLTQANGTQILTGICSNTPLGEIPKLENMPSTLIISPENGEKIKKNTPFKVLVHTTNVEFGFFSDPNSQYNAFPQALNDKGQIKGHQHVTIQFLGNKDNKTPPVATIFAFFKGLNDPSKTGKLEAPVELGLPKPGLYRMCTICSSNSHQSVVLPKAQRGATDDCIRFEIVD